MTKCKCNTDKYFCGNHYTFFQDSLMYAWRCVCIYIYIYIIFFYCPFLFNAFLIIKREPFFFLLSYGLIETNCWPGLLSQKHHKPKKFVKTIVRLILILKFVSQKHHNLSSAWKSEQSRSSLYSEYTAYGPETPGGPLAPKDDFILVSLLNSASS